MLFVVVASEIINFACRLALGKKIITRFEL